MTIGAMLVGHLGLTWDSATELSGPERWFGPSSRRYVEDAREALRAAGSPDRRISVVDGAVPAYVVPPAFVPFNRISEVFPLLDPALSFDRVDRPLFQFGDDRRLHPVAFRFEAGGSADELVALDRLFVPRGATPEKPGCLRSGQTPAGLELVAPPLPDGNNWYLHVRYSADGFHPVAGYVDRGAGYPAAFDVPLFMRKGRSTDVLGALGPTPVRRIRIDIPPSSYICFERFEIGQLVPR